jgi:hypothetical protein
MRDGAVLTVPPQVHNWSKAMADPDPGILATQARYGLHQLFGLDPDDPLVISAALAGAYYVAYLADVLKEAGTLTTEEAEAVVLVADQAQGHWRGALVELGAVPAPAEWKDTP